jgi:hypothetical protein
MANSDVKSPIAIAIYTSSFINDTEAPKIFPFCTKIFVTNTGDEEAAMLLYGR